MVAQKTFTEAEAQRFFAIQFHNKARDLLEKSDRTKEETELLIDYAHASLAHWRSAGTPINHQRGVWLLSRVYSVLGQVAPALSNANTCKQLTDQYPDLMQDFDLAFAWEALARANALAGNLTETARFRKLAEESGQLIKDKEDRQFFFEDLNGGDWHSFKE